MGRCSDVVVLCFWYVLGQVKIARFEGMRTLTARAIVPCSALGSSSSIYRLFPRNLVTFARI
jgi:hypothetical protein